MKPIDAARRIRDRLRALKAMRRGEVPEPERRVVAGSIVEKLRRRWLPHPKGRTK